MISVGNVHAHTHTKTHTGMRLRACMQIDSRKLAWAELCSLPLCRPPSAETTASVRRRSIPLPLDGVHTDVRAELFSWSFRL